MHLQHTTNTFLDWTRGLARPDTEPAHIATHTHGLCMRLFGSSGRTLVAVPCGLMCQLPLEPWPFARPEASRYTRTQVASRDARYGA
eukprot:2563264-Alexandrium_andersonii.AAC.1